MYTTAKSKQTIFYLSQSKLTHYTSTNSIVCKDKKAIFYPDWTSLLYLLKTYM